ncbi:Uncharacterized protein ChrSV_0591 [Chromobacterium vaccinii]|nr:Uncharacterized protein ChrSW_0591 [Chromobacterium vaccinii]QND88050.1 Uncharacterized protein ChrSV_0591 [Chromobacterium vaccinii]
MHTQSILLAVEISIQKSNYSLISKLNFRLISAIILSQDHINRLECYRQYS